MRVACFNVIALVFVLFVPASLLLVDRYGPRDSPPTFVSFQSNGTVITLSNPFLTFNASFLAERCSQTCGPLQACNHSAASVTTCLTCPSGWTMMYNNTGCRDLSSCLLIPRCDANKAALVLKQHDYIMNVTVANFLKYNTSTGNGTGPEAPFIMQYMAGRSDAFAVGDRSTVVTWFNDATGYWYDNLALYTPPAYYQPYIRSLKLATCNAQWTPSVIGRCVQGTISGQCPGTALTVAQLASWRVDHGLRADNFASCP